MKDKKIGAASLLGVKAAEQKLRKREIDALVDALPNGHPLKDDAERIKAESNGELAGLPDGHPLLMQLRQAEERYRASKGEPDEDGEETEKPEADDGKERRELRKANRIGEVKRKRQERVDSEEASERHRSAAKRVNKEVDDVVAAIRRLMETVGNEEKTLNEDQMTRARVIRMKRFLVAVERGMSDNKLSRMVANAR